MSRSRSQASRLRLISRERVFVNPLEEGRCGVLKNGLCWSVYEKDVYTWDSGAGAWTHKWSDDLNGSIVAGSIYGGNTEVHSSTKSNKRVRQADDAGITEFLGLVMATGRSLFVRLPFATGMIVRILNLDDFDLDDNETVTALAGCIDVNVSGCTVLMGTNRGRLIHTVIPQKGDPSATCIYDPDAASSFFTKLFTPKRRGSRMNVVDIDFNAAEAMFAAITKDRIVLCSLTKEVKTVDANRGAFLAIWIGTKSSFAILSMEEGKLMTLDLDSSGELRRGDVLNASLDDDYFNVRCFYFHNATYIVWQRGQRGEFVIWDGNSGEVLSQEQALQTDRPLSITVKISTSAWLILTKNGCLRSSARLGKDSSRDKRRGTLPVERLEGLSKCLVSEMIAQAKQLVAHDSLGDASDEMLSRLRLSDDFAEVAESNEESIVNASLCMFETIRAQIMRHERGERDVNVDLVVILVGLGIFRDWASSCDLSQSVTSERSLQLLGESILGSSECHLKCSAELDALDLSELTGTDNLGTCFQKLSQIPARKLDAGLTIARTLIESSKEFAISCGGSPPELPSSFRGEILNFLSHCLNQLQIIKQHRVASVTLKSVINMLKLMLEVRPHPDLLKLLMRFASEKSIDESLRSLALASVKQLSEEYTQFDALIISCLSWERKDFALIERCLEKTDERWRNFPQIVLDWMLEHDMTAKAFDLAQKSSSLNDHLIEALERRVRDQGGVRGSDGLWLARIEKDQWDIAATISIDAPNNSINILTAFAAGENEVITKQIHHGVSIGIGTEPARYVEMLYLALVLAKGVPRDKDFIWAHAVLADAEDWKQAQHSKESLDYSGTIFVQLSRLINERKQLSMLPGQDFFINLRDNLGDRASNTDRQHGFTLKQIKSLASVLLQCINK